MTTENDALETEPVDLELLEGIDDDQEEQSNEPTDEAEASDDETKDDDGQDETKDDESEAASSKRDAVIPRARFDDVNARLHAEREETARLRSELAARQEQPQQNTASLNELEDQFYEAFMSGEKDQALAIRAQINERIYAQSESAAERKLQEREASSSFNQAVAKAIADYPFLDPAKDVADAQAIADVVEWRDFYISRGDSPANAISQAVAKIAPMYQKQEPTQPQVPNTRQQQAIQRAVKDSSAQPPKMDTGVGNRGIPAGNAILDDVDKWSAATQEERMKHLA